MLSSSPLNDGKSSFWLQQCLSPVHGYGTGSRPDEKKYTIFSQKSLRLDSQQHSLRVFHELLKVLQPLCSYSPVNNSVIAGHCDSHHVGHRGAAISSNHNLLLCPADSQDARLWWVDDSRELVDAKHAQVGHSDGAPLVFVWR